MAATVFFETKLIVGEGGDDVSVLRAVSGHLGINGVDYEDFQGKDEWRRKIAALTLTRGFSSVNHLLLARDADGDAAAAFQSVADSLRMASLPVPAGPTEWAAGRPNVAVYIWPGGGASGEVEDLCLASVSGTPEYECVEAAVRCVTEKVGAPRKLAKAKLQVYLALQDEPCKTLPVAARRNLFPWDGEPFDDLRALIAAMA